MAQTAVEQLIALSKEPDPYGQNSAEVLALQVDAVQERLDERRGQIKVLDQRVRDVEIDTIKNWEDLNPLLFSHTTYKSYPDSFVSNGRWDKLLQWYGTLSTSPVDTVDLSGVATIDDWIERFWQNGLRGYASSGTSGKCSFLPAVMADRQTGGPIQSRYIYWPGEMPAENSLRWYQLTPKIGYYRGIESWNAMSDVLARPDAVHHLSDRPLLISDVTRAATMRKAMIDGTATPSQIAAFEAEGVARSAEMEGAIEEFAREIVAHREEPLAVVGLWSQQWAVVEAMRRQGVSPADFHPSSVVYGGGGTKGTKMPANYREQVFDYYPGAVHPAGYGMSELNTPFPRCSAQRYHQPPWIAVIVLDDTGEKVLNVEAGEAQGRAAFFDVTVTGRWGGTVTGDRISVRFGPCDCGRDGPTIGDDITRYSDQAGGDDKLSCSGTMEAYVRGAIDI